MENMIKTRFSALTANVSLARILTTGFVAPYDVTVEEMDEIKTIVSEAVTNAIIHGYQQENVGEVNLNLSIDKNNILVIEVEDHGKGIEDIDMARKPLFTTNYDDERSGMGFTIMEVFSDKLEVESISGKTVVRSYKRLNINNIDSEL